MASESFEEVFYDMFLAAFRLASKILEDRQAAEDAAAEACARAWANWGRLQKLPHRKAWVLRVASNLALDSVRRKRIGFSLPRPEDTADAVTLRLTLGAALRGLPRRQREAVVLRHVAGLSEREVADTLGVSVGSVKSHVSRGLASLRGQLRGEIDEVNLGPRPA